jgi:hypothetical protein
MLIEQAEETLAPAFHSRNAFRLFATQPWPPY